MAVPDVSLDRGLPNSIEAERSILGAILLENSTYNQAAELKLSPAEFFLDSHRRIYQRMIDLSETGRPIDYVTLAEELAKHRELEAVGGAAYVTSLTDGLPRYQNISHYVKIVRDKAMLRTLINVSQNAIVRAYEQAEPVEDVINAAEASIFAIAEDRMSEGFSSIPEIFRDRFGTMDKLLERGQEVTGLASGYTELDKMTSGLHGSELVIIAARPSMGKTAFAVNIAQNAAISHLRDGGERKVIALFSLEMSKDSLLMRMLAAQARVNSHKLRTGFISKEDQDKLIHGMSQLADSQLYIDDTAGITVSEMRAKARRLKQTAKRLDLIVIDYLQLITGTPGLGKKAIENRTQEVSAISRGLKLLAKELDVPVIALSQLSRAAEQREGGEPKLSDLRESGAIEQDADVVMFIHRPEYYDRENQELEGKASIIVAKQRNGPTGAVELVWIKDYTRFENML